MKLGEFKEYTLEAKDELFSKKRIIENLIVKKSSFY